MNTRTLLSLALSLSLISPAIANDIEPGKEFYTATRAANPIVVDGNLAEWGGVPVLADPRFYIPKGSGPLGTGTLVLFEEYAGGIWTGPDDHTSAVQIVYDSENVYFGFVVTDDYHENSRNSAWNGDSVQLMIANAARDQQIALYNYALGGIESDLGEVIVMHEAGPALDPGCDCETEAIVTRDIVNKKTIYEIRLPAAALGLTVLTPGTQFGLGMAINDGDDGPGQDGQKGWGGLGAHAIVFGKSPSETALITLGEGGPGEDRLFFSAINPTLFAFSFRGNDKGTSIMDPATVKLLIDSQPVTLVASAKTGDVIDFTHTRSAPFPPGSDHTYVIELKDTQGNTVTAEGIFKTENYGVLTAAHQALSVNRNMPGFIWRIFQNDLFLPETIADAELALAGNLTVGNQPMPNLAYSFEVGAASGEGIADGPLVKFDISTVINLSQTFGTEFGNFTPDEQMPGIPGLNFTDDGISAEIRTFVEFPAGLITMGVNSDDGFRTQAGYINNPADGVLLGEFDGSRGSADTLFRILVQDPGVYGLRTVYMEGTGGANIEWFTVKTDGTKVLLNDTANGGLNAYRVGVAPEKPFNISLGIQISNREVSITWTEPGAVLQESVDLKAWADLPAASSPHKPALDARTTVYYRLKK
jgi:hypothetical protein